MDTMRTKTIIEFTFTHLLWGSFEPNREHNYGDEWKAKVKASKEHLLDLHVLSH